jgi:8-oxo-dGTP pyrophosphatase MutT (NUDIX family)
MKKKDKLIEQARKEGSAQQVAALPYRQRGNGKIDVLVITSRRTKRLIVPKGWPMKGKADHKAAAIEAHEEAGVRGEIRNHPIGSFSYMKDLDEAVIPVTASVFPLKVKKLKPRWKEETSRKRKWLSATKAAALLSDRELGDLVARAAATLEKGSIESAR